MECCGNGWAHQLGDSTDGDADWGRMISAVGFILYELQMYIHYSRGDEKALCAAFLGIIDYASVAVEHKLANIIRIRGWLGCVFIGYGYGRKGEEPGSLRSWRMVGSNADASCRGSGRMCCNRNINFEECNVY